MGDLDGSGSVVKWIDENLSKDGFNQSGFKIDPQSFLELVRAIETEPPLDQDPTHTYFDERS